MKKASLVLGLVPMLFVACSSLKVAESSLPAEPGALPLGTGILIGQFRLTLQGTGTNDDGDYVGNAHATLMNHATRKEVSVAVQDARDGVFFLVGLPEGAYYLRGFSITRKGEAFFRKSSDFNITVQSGKINNVGVITLFFDEEYGSRFTNQSDIFDPVLKKYLSLPAGKPWVDLETVNLNIK